MGKVSQSTMLRLQKPRGTLACDKVTVMGSKYIANRLLILGALAHGESIFKNVPINDDLAVARKGIALLGAQVKQLGSQVWIKGTGGAIVAPREAIFTGASGTFSRLLAPVAALSEAPITIRSDDQMATRPMEALFQALTTWGATIKRHDSKKSFPITLNGPLHLAPLKIAGKVSSQFISALLLVAPYLRFPSQRLGKTLPSPASSLRSQLTPPGAKFSLTLTTHLVSRSYVALTCALMELYGVRVDSYHNDGYQAFTIALPATYHARHYTVESDVVAASYFWGLAMLKGCPLTIEHYPQHSLMGEAKWTTILTAMGAQFSPVATGMKIIPPPPNQRWQGVNVAMQDMPDVVPTLAVMALSGTSPTCLTGIGHLRFKESNRVDDLATELRKLGGEVKVDADALTIFPLPDDVLNANRDKIIHFDSHDDHRLAMALALCALMVKEVRLTAASSVKKSFPDYFTWLAKLGFSVQAES